ncbi:uncharacterized protein LOC135398603 [Ornithodoros turicata]|uniref:uncharacterized protein LOC135398603 n=1 Tax=Ornithodoros turicata TaxID=34597 RepID=UPI0031394A8A
MDRLKAKRASRRTQTTKILNEATSTLKDGTAAPEVLNALIQRLTPSHTELLALNEAIEPLVQDFEAECNTVLDYEDKVTEAKANPNWKLSQLQITCSSTIGTTTGQRGGGSTTSTRRTGVKLPKLKLTTFGGNLCEWHGFWEQFKATVHDNGDLQKIEKFQYLRSLPSGQAAAAIAGLPVSEASYDNSTEILTERFGDKGRIEKQLL